MRERQTAERTTEDEALSAVPTVEVAPATLSVARVLALQRTAGNHNVAALLSGARQTSISRCPDCGGTCKDGCEEKHAQEEEDEERAGNPRAKSIGGAKEPSNTAPDP